MRLARKSRAMGMLRNTVFSKMVSQRAKIRVYQSVITFGGIIIVETKEVMEMYVNPIIIVQVAKTQGIR